MGAVGVVVIGGGHAGCQVAASLRELGYPGRLTVVSDEETMPYQRPPLSKAYLKGSVELDEVLIRPGSYYPGQEIELRYGERVTRIDRAARSVTLRGGDVLGYDRLVLATGARPRPLPVPGADLAGVLSLRTLADSDALRGRLAGRQRIVVIGGGFTGLELAASARQLGHEVTVVEALPRIMARAVSSDVSVFLTGEHRRQGTELLLGRGVQALEGDVGGHVTGVVLADGERLPADLVVVGIGVIPNVELAEAAGLAVDNGVVVDERLRTSDPAISAIGDCARYPSRHAGREVRLESVQNAVDHARCVAADICGDSAPYASLPWFWSDQYAAKLQIAGITDGHDRTVVTGDPDAGRFSVFCFRGDRLLGVESINRPGDYIAARRLLAGEPDLTPDEVARPGFELKSRQRAA